jgi:predicted peptidase
MPLAVVLGLFVAACGSGGRRSGRDDGAFVARSVVVGGLRHDYQVFVPHGAGPGSPVILFLHGSGERGSDNQRQIEAGLGPHVRAHAADFPAITVFPQSPEGSSWEGEVADAALAALDDTLAAIGGDRRRIYLTGLSRGGYGVWEIALAHPDRFAALVPICGGLRPPPGRTDLMVGGVRAPDLYVEAAERLRAIPTWIFHGARDEVVPPEGSRRMAAAMRAAGADVRYTEYPQATHNAWDPAYAEPGLWSWLFAQRRP